MSPTELNHAPLWAHARRFPITRSLLPPSHRHWTALVFTVAAILNHQRLANAAAMTSMEYMFRWTRKRTSSTVRLSGKIAW